MNEHIPSDSLDIKVQLRVIHAFELQTRPHITRSAQTMNFQLES